MIDPNKAKEIVFKTKSVFDCPETPSNFRLALKSVVSQALTPPPEFLPVIEEEETKE